MIIAFTGAGISKESGLPTFMEIPLLREKLSRSYATSNPQDYNKTILDLHRKIQEAEPNDAHLALAEYDIPVITMNVDGLHEKAGTMPMTLHGTMPSESEMSYAHELWNKPVLYGDPAPNYQKAMIKINSLCEDDILIVIGASLITAIAIEIREMALSRGVRIIEIQDNASKEVRKTLEELKAEKKL